MTMQTYRLAPAGCPVCLNKLDAASNDDAGTRGPIAGDITVCLYCGVALEFGAGMAIKRLSATTRARMGSAELAELARISTGILLTRMTRRKTA